MQYEKIDREGGREIPHPIAEMTAMAESELPSLPSSFRWRLLTVLAMPVFFVAYLRKKPNRSNG